MSRRVVWTFPVQGWQHPTKLYRDIVHEPAERAVGAGSGMLVTAVTSHGHILGTSVPAERGRPAQEIGQQAVSKLLKDLHTGACVDQW